MFNDPATAEIYTLSLHDALPISTWSAGTMTGAGSTVANGGLTIGGTTVQDITERELTNNGTRKWSEGSSGRIRTGFGASIQNNGLWQDQNSISTGITNDFGGGAS